MTTRTEVITKLSILTGVPKHRLDHQGVELRKAGYIPSKGRGKSALAISRLQAAFIVVGMLGGEMPKDAPLAVDRCIKLRDAHGNDFMNALLGTLRDSQNVGAVAVIRNFPKAMIHYYKTSETGEILKEWTTIFTDPDFKEKLPPFQLEAKIDGSVLGVIGYAIDNR